MIGFTSVGDFSKTEAFLNRILKGNLYSSLSGFAAEGVSALSRATPRESGETANAWTSEIIIDGKSASIIWSNGVVVDGTPVAVLLQVGHGTGTGGYVAGRDFINPALQPLFDRIANDVWKEVTSA